MLEKIISWLTKSLRELLGPEPCHYINGPDTLPPPLTKEQEQKVMEDIKNDVPGAREPLITHNLRLVLCRCIGR